MCLNSIAMLINSFFSLFKESCDRFHNYKYLLLYLYKPVNIPANRIYPYFFK